METWTIEHCYPDQEEAVTCESDDVCEEWLSGAKCGNWYTLDKEYIRSICIHPSRCNTVVHWDGFYSFNGYTLDGS